MLRYRGGMESSRLPRFKRVSAVSPIQLTERDREILRQVHQHRFLRSSHLGDLLGSSSQQLLRRLQLLYHHGYLERPRAQLNYYLHGGSRSIVYGLGSKGASAIGQPRVEDLSERPWGEQNRAAGRIFLAHSLLVSDVMVAIEIACRGNGNIRFIPEHELAPVGKRDAFRWSVRIPGISRLSVVPDRVFALEYVDRHGQNQRQVFFLEADRGTMPVVRKRLTQTSFYRKLLAYEATWSQSIHRRLFGFHRFRVLTVTTNAKRIESMVIACAKLKRGHGLFLFGDQSILQKPKDILSVVWQSGKTGGTGGLLD